MSSTSSTPQAAMGNAVAIDTAQPFRDRKRYAWLFSLLVPVLLGCGPALYLATGQTLVLWMPLLIVYGVFPLLDLLLGEDSSNPPESAVPALEADHYYRWITWALVPMLWIMFIGSAWFATHQPLPWHGWLALALSTGVLGGFCINVGHELGHKRGALERWLAKLVLSPTGYGHFYVEHNRGHHRDVATPADPASSRLGESLWRFVLRELPGAWRRGWDLEVERMRALGKPWWSLANDIVQTSLITLALWLVLVMWLGAAVLPFLLLASLWANFQLSCANYIEHYGISRKRLADGRYEACKPHHSWNSNHIASNWALFHLQRHSDHHAHATRRYQSLRSFEGLPQLPSGYFSMFVLAYFPHLWFRVMDRRLLQLVEGDIERINFDPSRRQSLMRKYGLGQGEARV